MWTVFANRFHPEIEQREWHGLHVCCIFQVPCKLFVRLVSDVFPVIRRESLEVVLT